MGDLIFNIDFKKFTSETNVVKISVVGNAMRSQSGIAKTQENQLIKFHNKPHKKSDIGNLSSSGIFLINKKILKFI